MDAGRIIVVTRSFLKPSLSMLALVCLISALSVAISAVVGAESGANRFRRRQDLLIHQIVKNAEAATYPPDEFWKKIQKRIPVEEAFPCDNMADRPQWRSDEQPLSVHKLRPGDIDVIGAMGDSLTSGNGAREFSPIGIGIQDRGVSFSGGGLATWREFITLPNILKVFNPSLIGYSLGRGDFGSYNAQLNVAIPAALDDDALTQAKIFVSKTLRNPKINFTSDWKLLTILIGQNDLCSYQCFYQDKNSPKEHKLNLQKALDYLYSKVPRLFVNIISTLDTTITARLERSPFCQIMNRLICACLFHDDDLQKNLIQMSQLARKYQEAEKELANSKRYSGRDDFTVELQPFFQFSNKPRQPRHLENRSLLRSLNVNNLYSPDCTHFNQKGMKLVSTFLWNNMLEPVKNKSIKFQEYSIQDIRCPTKKAPYLFTKENSKMYINTGHQ